MVNKVYQNMEAKILPKWETLKIPVKNYERTVNDMTRLKFNGEVLDNEFEDV